MQELLSSQINADTKVISMRNLIAKTGRKRLVILITLTSIVLSVSIATVLMMISGTAINSTSMLISIITSSFIVALVSWNLIGLFKRVHYLELEQRKFATYDDLTEALSRRAFYDNSSALLRLSKRNHESLTVALIDIDDFKLINDTYGHDVGDEALRSFSTVLRKILRESDIVGRIGGEEFAVTFFKVDINNSIRILERIRKAIENTELDYLDNRIKYTISIGVSEYNGSDSSDFEDLIKLADNALYVAKSSGKNRIESATFNIH